MKRKWTVPERMVGGVGNSVEGFDRSVSPYFSGASLEESRSEWEPAGDDLFAVH